MGADMALVVTIHDMHILLMVNILKALCPFVAWSSPGNGQKTGQKTGQRYVVVNSCSPKRGWPFLRCTIDCEYKLSGRIRISLVTWRNAVQWACAIRGQKKPGWVWCKRSHWIRRGVRYGKFLGSVQEHSFNCNWMRNEVLSLSVGWK